MGKQYRLQGTALARPVAAVYVLARVGSLGAATCPRRLSGAGGLGGIALPALVQQRLFGHHEALGQFNHTHLARSSLS